MHVPQLLDPLALAPQIEIVEAALAHRWLFLGKALGWHEGRWSAARGCENQRQILDAFGFWNAHPPAKNPREGWGNRRA